VVEDARELREDDPLAVEATAALHSGDVDATSRLLAAHPELARTRIVSRRTRGGSRTLLHLFADWPGQRPHAREIVALLQAAGADVDATCNGPDSETALHWAASSDDVELIDALLDAGANLEARGAVIGGGTALADATAFGQWRAAERLLERGAHTNLFESAVMGLNDRVEAELDATPTPTAENLTHALWGACHGGRQETAAVLLARGADINWVGWDDLTPLDAAERTASERPDATPLVDWLRERGARSATDPS
jgi:ankyrin repeat protein